MSENDTILIPLHNKQGIVVAHAIIDREDADQARYTWCKDSDGYAVRVAVIDGRSVTLRLHREILGLSRGDGVEVDHANRLEKLDNRRSNLRIATRGQNRQNVGPYRNSRSQYRGVIWDKRRNKWRAQAQLEGRFRHIGYFDSKEDAAEAASTWRANNMPYAVEADRKAGYSIEERTMQRSFTS